MFFRSQRFIADLDKAEGIVEVSVEARARMQGKTMSMILGNKTDK